ncbi:MAG: hypothetical protein IPM90_16370 [Austwickia sp.]|nr:hypothetical protein [Austwickia sp.]
MPDEPGRPRRRGDRAVLLKDVRIQDYRSVEDSGTVPIEIDVTCLVGKNESGKTAFLQGAAPAQPTEPD